MNKTENRELSDDALADIAIHDSHVTAGVLIVGGAIALIGLAAVTGHFNSAAAPPAPPTATGVITQLAPQTTCQGLNGQLNGKFNFIATSPAVARTLKADQQNDIKVELHYAQQKLPACNSYNVATGNKGSTTYTVSPKTTANVVTGVSLG